MINSSNYKSVEKVLQVLNTKTKLYNDLDYDKIWLQCDFNKSTKENVTQYYLAILLDFNVLKDKYWHKYLQSKLINE